MRWKRRRSRWPAAAALIGLLLLTLVAPQAWLRREGDAPAPAPPEESPVVARTDESRETPVAKPNIAATTRRPPPVEPPPAPPLVRPGAAHLKPNADLVAPISSPIVDNDDYADDYVVVNDPPVATTLPLEELDDVEEELLLRPELLLLPPVNETVEIEPPPQPEPQLDLEDILQMRNALEAFVSRTAEAARDFKQAATTKAKAESPASPIVRPESPRVRVDSPFDRLAMASERSILILPTPSGDPSEPIETDLPERKPQRSAEGQESAPTQSAPTPIEETDNGPVVPRVAKSLSRQRPPVLTDPPETLISQLLVLREYAKPRPWVDSALDAIGQLSNGPPSVATADAARQLSELTKSGLSQAAAAENPRLKTEWLRSAQAISRRLPVWNLLADPHFESARIGTAGPDETNDVTGALHEVAALTTESAAGSAWRQYLLLDDLADHAAAGADGDRRARRRAAQRALARMTDVKLTPDQRSFLRTSALKALRRSLLPWAAGDVPLKTLAAIQERYESQRPLRYAHAMAQLTLQLRWSGKPEYVALADHLEKTYRQPNVRIAVTDDLMNRLAPKPEPAVAPVRDRVRGAEIRGRSRTTTELAVQLKPDQTQWRVALVADGNVRSQTYSNTWPARVRNAGQLRFHASKEIVLTPSGLTTQPTRANVQGRNRLVGVESNLDSVPILGSLTRGVARQRHDRNQGAALAEVKSKVARQARRRMDRATEEKLDELEVQFRTRVLAPLEQLAVSAEPVDMFTTEQRAVMRLRMAGEQQLAAHTPRPSAPSDSLMSLQMHESALNNAIVGLGLNGQRMKAVELYEVLGEKLTGKTAPAPVDLPKRARVEFAKHDAARIAYHDDQLELIMNIAELSHGRDRIRNFQVHAFYEPEVNGLRIDLVRTGTLQFSGPRLRTGPRVALHSVFGKMLHKAQRVPVLRQQMENDERLAGLMVTQLVIDDGWIAVALGPAHPARVAWRTRLAGMR